MHTWLCLFTTSIVFMNNCICVPGFAWTSTIVYHSTCRYIPLHYCKKLYQYFIASGNIGVPDSIINSKYLVNGTTMTKSIKTLESVNVSHFPRKSVVEPDHINQKDFHSLYNTLDKKIMLSLNTEKYLIFYNFKRSFTSSQKLCRLAEKLSINLS